MILRLIIRVLDTDGLGDWVRFVNMQTQNQP